MPRPILLPILVWIGSMLLFVAVLWRVRARKARKTDTLEVVRSMSGARRAAFVGCVLVAVDFYMCSLRVILPLSGDVGFVMEGGSASFLGTVTTRSFFDLSLLTKSRLDSLREPTEHGPLKPSAMRTRLNILRSVAMVVFGACRCIYRSSVLRRLHLIPGLSIQSRSMEA